MLTILTLNQVSMVTARFTILTMKLGRSSDQPSAHIINLYCLSELARKLAALTTEFAFGNGVALKKKSSDQNRNSFDLGLVVLPKVEAHSL